MSLGAVGIRRLIGTIDATSALFLDALLLLVFETAPVRSAGGAGRTTFLDGPTGCLQHVPQPVEAIFGVLPLVAETITADHEIAGIGQPGREEFEQSLPYLGRDALTLGRPVQNGFAGHLVDVSPPGTRAARIRNPQFGIGNLNAGRHDEHGRRQSEGEPA